MTPETAHQLLLVAAATVAAPALALPLARRPFTGRHRKP